MSCRRRGQPPDPRFASGRSPAAGRAPSGSPPRSFRHLPFLGAAQPAGTLFFSSNLPPRRRAWVSKFRTNGLEIQIVLCGSAIPQRFLLPAGILAPDYPANPLAGEFLLRDPLSGDPLSGASLPGDLLPGDLLPGELLPGEPLPGSEVLASGACGTGSASSGFAPSDSVLPNSAPSDFAPSGSAPSGSAPSGPARFASASLSSLSGVTSAVSGPADLPSFERFALGVYPFLELQPFHRAYYRVLGGFRRGPRPAADRHHAAPARQKRRRHDPASGLCAGAGPRSARGDRLLFGSAGVEIQPPCPAYHRVARVRRVLPRDDHQAGFQAAQLYPHGRRGRDHRLPGRPAFGRAAKVRSRATASIVLSSTTSTRTPSKPIRRSSAPTAGSGIRRWSAPACTMLRVS